MDKSLIVDSQSPGIGVDGCMKASVKEDACPGCFRQCHQCCGSRICTPSWSSNVMLHLLMTGKILRSYFRKLTAFANAELTQPCESWVTLCTGLIFAQHVKSIGEKKCQGLRKEELLYYFSCSDVFFSLLSLNFLKCAVAFVFKADCSFKTEPYPAGVCQGLLTGHSWAIPTWALRCPRPTADTGGKMVHISVCKSKYWSASSFTARARFSRNTRKTLPKLKISQPGLWVCAARD